MFQKHEAEVRFKCAHTRTHAVTEWATGLYKQRFLCVSMSAGGLQLHPTTCCTVVVVTVLLHNMGPDSKCHRETHLKSTFATTFSKHLWSVQECRCVNPVFSYPHTIIQPEGIVMKMPSVKNIHLNCMCVKLECQVSLYSEEHEEHLCMDQQVYVVPNMDIHYLRAPLEVVPKKYCK